MQLEEVELVENLANNLKKAQVSAVAHREGMATIWSELTQDQKNKVAEVTNKYLNILNEN